MMIKKTTPLASLLGLLAASGLANADVNDNSFRGSDTLEVYTNRLIDLCREQGFTGVDANGPLNYSAEGSSNGENAMRDGEQEIAPMSRFLDDTACEIDDGKQAAGLVVAVDALVLVSGARAAELGDTNDSVGNDTTDDGTSLAFTRTYSVPGAASYTLGASSNYTGAIDLLRVMFGGADNTLAPEESAGAAGCGSPLRRALQANYNSLVQSPESGASPAASCGEFFRNPTTGAILYDNDGDGTPDSPPQPQGVKFPTASLVGGALQANTAPLVDGAPAAVATQSHHLLRRADFSGTTGTFIGFLGMADLEFTDDVPTGGPFCNGTEFDDNDPVRVACTPEMDVCGNDGNAGWVLPIFVPGERDASSPLGALTAADIYPTEPCLPGNFANAPNPIDPATSGQITGCPDGALEFAGTCPTPRTADNSFACLNLFSNVSTFGAGDGRVFNKTVRTADGSIIRDGNGFQIFNAWYRMASRQEDELPTFPQPPVERDCLEGDSTRQIGCLAGRLDCTSGFAGREASLEPNALGHAIAGIDPDAPATGYELERNLYYNSISGFSNVTEGDGPDSGTAVDLPENALLACMLAGTTSGGQRITDIAAADSGFFPLGGPVICQPFSSSDSAVAGCGVGPGDLDPCSLITPL